LGIQPLLEAVFLYIFQVGFHGPVVRPLIGHEIMEWRAGIFFAETAEIDALLCGAMPEPASLDIVVRTAAAAAVAVRGSAGAAIKSARPILGMFHHKILFLEVDVLMVASHELHSPD